MKKHILFYSVLLLIPVCSSAFEPTETFLTVLRSSYNTHVDMTLFFPNHLSGYARNADTVCDRRAYEALTRTRNANGLAPLQKEALELSGAIHVGFIPFNAPLPRIAPRSLEEKEILQTTYRSCIENHTFVVGFGEAIVPVPPIGPQHGPRPVKQAQYVLI